MQRRTIYTHPTSGTASPYWNEKSSKLINILNTEWFYSPENETHAHMSTVYSTIPYQHSTFKCFRSDYIVSVTAASTRFSLLHTHTTKLCALHCAPSSAVTLERARAVSIGMLHIVHIEKILIRLLMFSNVMTVSSLNRCSCMSRYLANINRIKVDWIRQALVSMHRNEYWNFCGF